MKTSFASVSFAVLAAMIELLGFARQAVAVPIPWKNCGSATDIISVQQLNASIWPPIGTPAPLQATASYDPATGALSTMTINVLLGPEWVFETGNQAAPLVGGFVALPSSIPLTLVSPALPIPAGPTNITQVFTSSNPGSLPVTIQNRTVVAQSIPSVNATLTLTYNGTPGFPVPPSAGTYQATLQASESSGPEIFCFTISLANISFVEAPVTSTTLSSSANPSVQGQAVSFTATVSSSAGTPTGAVNFNDGATLLGTAAVDALGHAAFTTSLAAGTHNITATFNGSGAFAGTASTSAVLVQTVAVPTTTLDARALLMLAVALAAIGALVLRRS